MLSHMYNACFMIFPSIGRLLSKVGYELMLSDKKAFFQTKLAFPPVYAMAAVWCIITCILRKGSVLV